MNKYLDLMFARCDAPIVMNEAKRIDVLALIAVELAGPPPKAPIKEDASDYVDSRKLGL